MPGMNVSQSTTHRKLHEQKCMQYRSLHVKMNKGTKTNHSNSGTKFSRLKRQRLSFNNVMIRLKYVKRKDLLTPKHTSLSVKLKYFAEI